MRLPKPVEKAVIVSRNEEKGQALAKEFGCEWQSPGKSGRLAGDCLINTDFRWNGSARRTDTRSGRDRRGDFNS